MMPCHAFRAIDISLQGTTGRRLVAALRLWVAVIGTLAMLGATNGTPVRAAPGSAEPALRPGRATAPNPFEVEVRDVRGRRLRLADFKGAVVLVDLWASWCAECRTSFPALDALSREYRSRGVTVVAVNLDERRKDATAFLAARPHEMLVVFDPKARLFEAFGAAGVPSSYLIDRQGTVRYHHSGYTAATETLYRQQLDLLVAEPAR